MGDASGALKIPYSRLGRVTWPHLRCRWTRLAHCAATRDGGAGTADARLQTRAETGELKTRLQAGYALRQMEASGRADISRLSPRESEVPRFLARGYTNREIGAALRLSPGTCEIRSHA